MVKKKYLFNNNMPKTKKASRRKSNSPESFEVPIKIDIGMLEILYQSEQISKDMIDLLYDTNQMDEDVYNQIMKIIAEDEEQEPSPPKMDYPCWDPKATFECDEPQYCRVKSIAKKKGMCSEPKDDDSQLLIKGRRAILGKKSNLLKVQQMFEGQGVIKKYKAKKGKKVISPIIEFLEESPKKASPKKASPKKASKAKKSLNKAAKAKKSPKKSPKVKIVFEDEDPETLLEDLPAPTIKDISKIQQGVEEYMKTKPSPQERLPKVKRTPEQKISSLAMEQFADIEKTFKKCIGVM